MKTKQMEEIKIAKNVKAAWKKLISKEYSTKSPQLKQLNSIAKTKTLIWPYKKEEKLSVNWTSMTFWSHKNKITLIK